jgi:hypothetical protein
MCFVQHDSAHLSQHQGHAKFITAYKTVVRAACKEQSKSQYTQLYSDGCFE